MNHIRRPALVIFSIIVSSLAGGAIASAAPLFPNPQFHGAAKVNRAVTVDLNRDGRPDLVAALANATLAVFLGDGAGGFSQAMPIGPGGPSIAIGDLDADGFPDVADAGFTLAGIRVHLGHGDGTFKAPLTLPFGGTEIAAGDMNGDGRCDLVGIESWGLQPYMSQSDGTFTRPTGLADTSVVKVAFADFDADGKADLVVVHRYSLSQTFSISFLRSGGGTGQAAFTMEGSPGNLVMGDLDADGFADLAIQSSAGPPGLYVFFGAPTGPITKVGPLPAAAGGVSIGDFDGDGLPDLGTNYSLTVRVLAHSGPRSFVALPDQMLDADFNLAGDFDADGRVDLAMVGSENAAYLGRGDGTIDLNRIDVGSAPLSIASADFDEDGNPDLVAGSLTRPYHVSVVPGLGNGSFAQHVDYPMPDTVLTVAACDVDGDGHQDVAAINGPAVGPIVSVFYGSGNGALLPAVTLTAPDGFFNEMRCVDVNRDGRGDLVFNHFEPALVAVVLGRADRGLGPEVDYPTVVEGHTLDVGDVDEDGFADIVFGGTGLGYLPGRGDGTFSAERSISAAGDVRDLTLRDLDLDGHLDIALAQGSPAQVAVHHGAGTGHFASLQVIGPTAQPYAILATDLNRDGWPDLAVSNVAQEHYLAVHLGVGGGAFGQQTRYALGRDGRTLAAADFDHDGGTDIAATTSDNLAVLLNLATTLPDLDGDGIADGVDDCVTMPNPLQSDSDGDSFGDACDCAPTDPGAFALPGEVSGLMVSGTSLSWASLAGTAGPGTLYDVARGDLDGLPVGGGSGETCMDPGDPSNFTTDATIPPVGAGFWYLVRAGNVCGAGDYGTSSSGAPRVTPICP